MPKVIKECTVCGTSYPTRNLKQKTCSKKCMGLASRGKNNPNFGNKWSDEQKQKMSDYQQSISRVTAERVKKDWEGNTKRRQDAAETMSNTMSQMVGEKNHFYGKSHTEEALKIISEKSSEKFTEDYVNAYRKVMEDGGHWVPLEQKTEKELYFKESNWIKRMFDIIPNGLDAIDEHGVFHAAKNNNGVVRDHIIGRKYGFENKVFPEILRHPCNCQIITQAENISKGQRGKGRPDKDIELEELFNIIKLYDGEWLEHELVLSLIKDYEDGKQWKLQGGVLNE